MQESMQHERLHARKDSDLFFQLAQFTLCIMKLCIFPPFVITSFQMVHKLVVNLSIANMINLTINNISIMPYRQVTRAGHQLTAPSRHSHGYQAQLDETRGHCWSTLTIAGIPRIYCVPNFCSRSWQLHQCQVKSSSSKTLFWLRYWHNCIIRHPWFQSSIMTATLVSGNIFKQRNIILIKELTKLYITASLTSVLNHNSYISVR